MMISLKKRKRALQKNSPNHRGRLKEGAVARSSRALLFFMQNRMERKYEKRSDRTG